MLLFVYSIIHTFIHSHLLELTLNKRLDQNRNFRMEKLRKNNFGQKLSDAFSGILDKKLSDKHDIKKQHDTKIYVKTKCDSIININL